MPNGQTTGLLYPEIFDYLTAIEKRRKLKKTLGEFQIDGDEYNLLAAIDAGISEELLVDAFGQETYESALAEKQKPTVVPEIPFNLQPGEWFGDIEKLTQFEQEVIPTLPQELRAQYGNIPMEQFAGQFNLLMQEQEIKEQETIDLFKSVIPQIYEGVTEETEKTFTQNIIGQLKENPEFAESFFEVIQQQGRTPETEQFLANLMPELTEEDLTEFFPKEVPMPEATPEAVLQLEPEWENIRTGEIITKSEKDRRYPRGYEAELDEWRLTTETARNYGSVFKVFAETLTRVPKQLGAAILQAVQGQAGASVVNKDWADEWIADAATEQKEFVSKVAQEYTKTRLPVNIVDVAELPQNIAFSLTSMGAGLIVGVPVALAPVPGARVAAWALGTAASGAVAYNMTTYQIMQQYLEIKNDEMMTKVGRGLTAQEEEALKADFSNQAMKYGLWEAIPEALSNLAFAKILTMPLGKMVGRNIASQIIGKLFSLYGEELLTETITQKGQSDIEVEAGLRDGKITWVEAFKEIAPQTFLLTTVLGGLGQTGVSSVNRIKQSLKKEIGESPLHDTIRDNISEVVFSEVEAEATIPPRPTEARIKELQKMMGELPEKPPVAPEPAVTPTEVPAKPVTPEVAKIPPTYENLTEGQTIVDQAGDRWTITKIDKEGVPAKWGYTIKGEKIDLTRTRPLGEIERYYKIEQPPLPTPEAGMPEAGYQPAIATETIEPTKAPEKAANIRLEKYPEEVRPVIQEWADTHGAEVKEATRGIVSDAQVRAEAERLTTEVGGDLSKLRKKWKPATAWNAEELVAIRSVLRAKTQEVLSAQKLVKENNSSQNLLKLELALKEQAAVQEMVHGLTAEAGRALRSFRQEAFDALKANDVSRMEELLRKIRGNREDTEKIAAMLGRLDPTDPVAVNKFIQELYKPHVMDYLIELFYNSILSGPKTHIVNSLSNTANAIFSPIERAVSALVDLPLSFIEQRPRARFLNEVPADIFGAIRGIPEGFRQFAWVIKNGISFDQATKWEFRQKAFRGKLGAAISMPSRFLEGADVLMKAINQRAALNAEAHRIASTEKLKGQEFEDRVAELLSSPTTDMLSEANRIAEYRLFRQVPGKFGQTLMNLRDAVSVFGIRPLRFVIPFIRTPLNLVKFGLERTPLGFVNPKLWQNVAQSNPEAADQIARATIGAVGLATISWYFAAGMITGAPPRDRAERDRFYREGKQPYAIRVNGFWVSYQRLEPFNQLLGMVAIISDAIQNNDKGVGEKILDAVNTFGQNFISQTYMSSVSDLLDMLGEPERYAGKWLNRFASSMFVPMSSATRTAAQMFDQVVRDPDNAWETIEASIPGLSTKVKSKLSVLGEDIVRKSPPWFPINVTPVEETVLSQELERLKFDIGFVGASISGIKLTDAEQREYQISSGKLIKDDLEKLMLAPEYWQATDAEKDKMLRKVVDAARDWSRAKMRESIWAKGTTEDRVEVLETAIVESDKQLGKIISEVNTFTHEPANIYDIEHELDSSYRALLQGISEDTLKGMTLPPSLHSWYAKEEAVKVSSFLPDMKLIDINADTTIGKSTFEDYYNQWQKRGKITDERKLEDFDKKYGKAHLGNISRRQLELLREYHKLTKPEQEKFLEGLSEVDRKSLVTNAYTGWLKSNPKENALLAIWGQAKILTKDAYTEYNRLVRELDVVDSALPKLTLPPPTSIDTHFTYLDLVADNKGNSWEGQILLKKDDIAAKEAGVQSYVGWRSKEGEPLELSDTPMASLEIKTELVFRETYNKIQDFSDKNSPDYKDNEIKDANGLTARDRAVAEARATKIGDSTYRDIERKVEVIEKGTDEKPIDDKLVTAHIEYMRMQDAEGIGSSTAEVMLYRVDNPSYNDWRMDEDVWGDKALKPIEEDKIPIWRIDAKWRDKDAEYEAIDPDAKNLETGIRLRDEMLALPKNEDYRKDRRRRNAYQLNLSGDVVEKYVDFYELPETGYRRERYRMNNPDLDKVLTDRNTMGDSVMVPVDPAEVPAEEYDNLREKWVTELNQYEKEIPKKYEKIVDSDERAKLIREDRAKLLANREFADDRLRINAYSDFFPEEYVENYVEYYNIPDKGYANERYLKEHPDFYKVIKETLGWTEDIKFDKIPTERFENAFNNYYDVLPKGKAREDYRWNNRWFDEEGAKLGWWKLLERGPKLSQADRMLMEWYNRLQELEKAGEAQLVK